MFVEIVDSKVVDLYPVGMKTMDEENDMGNKDKEVNDKVLEEKVY